MIPLTMIVGVGLGLALFLAIVSRHKKSSTGSVKLIGLTGFVQTMLDPTGTVIIDGELWRARSRNGSKVGTAKRVSVVALENHLLIVDQVPDHS
jgi:membrane-bound serine protease (ClpP class)